MPVLREVSLEVAPGEFLGLVGESGSGKSLTALAVMGLLPEAAAVEAGEIVLDGVDLLGLSEQKMQGVRGRRVGLVFQEPLAALDPVFTIGFQIVEAVRAHHQMGRRAARAEAERLLELVSMPEPRRRLGDYPHQLSGGQRQRALLAMALAAGPDLLIADEPTTALDVTVQAQILDLFHRLREELGLALLLITHDLAVVAETCDRVVVMYCGEVLEAAGVVELFQRPAHPYTRGLLDAAPVVGNPAPRGHMPMIGGQVAEPAQRPAGCAFHPRCPEVMPICSRRHPESFSRPGGGHVRCFLHGDSAEEEGTR